MHDNDDYDYTVLVKMEITVSNGGSKREGSEKVFYDHRERKREISNNRASHLRQNGETGSGGQRSPIISGASAMEPEMAVRAEKRRNEYVSRGRMERCKGVLWRRKAECQG